MENAKSLSDFNIFLRRWTRYSFFESFFIRTFAPIMANYQDFEQLKAFARIDGMLVVLLWTASFLCCMKMAMNPMLFLIALAIGAFSLAYAAMRLKRFRDTILDGYISYRRALAYSIMTYLYASLLFAGIQFIYFQFIDGGSFINMQLEAIKDPQAQKMMQSVYGLTPQDIEFAVENLRALTPIRIAMQFFTTNVLMGLIVSVPVALIMQRRKLPLTH